MAEFSRIQVNPAEEEDIVIVAGAVDQTASEGDSDATSAATSDEADADVALAVDRFASHEAASSRPHPHSTYQETTLEDLQRARMSGMQKAIIALAIVAVVAFIIWYVLLR